MVYILEGEEMKPIRPIPEDLFVAHAKELEGILQKAVREALLIHKRLGNPIAVWQDGKVVILRPEEIPVEDPLSAKTG